MTARKPAVLAVNSNRRNLDLLKQFLERNGYQVTGVASLDEMGQALQSDVEFAVALVDIVGFSRQIWTHCETLNKAGVPFFVISPKQSSTLQQESMQYRAKGVWVMPLVVKEPLGLINTGAPPGRE